ncbi:MAG: glycoside hydrolase family 127 protein [Bacteroidetes bacterium]|nr:glycoside hydrolase family 127 protein [Bacteroidota bacterium]
MNALRFIATSLLVPVMATAQQPAEKIEMVNFSKVNITDNFWKPKIDKVAVVTIPVCIDQTEVKTPRLRNFEKVARKKGEKHEGIFYDDSDVYKALEAMAYSLKTHPDAKLEAKADEWIDKIAAAQQPDGYLNTYFTLNGLQDRYTDMSMHEDYNCGHMIEAAVAYYNVTGKRKFLDVAIKWANHFSSIFGPGKRDWVTGHQELELALVKLFRVTNDSAYVKFADWLLSERGHKLAKGYTWTDWKDTAYAQDVLPVKEQKEITGHAVRAMYMYTGAADVASVTGDAGYMNAMKTVWEDVVYRNMYITGGIGSSGGNEGFSNDYDLPNENAYCETCASVGMVFWNQRMNALTGESKYMDVLEKSLYNGALDGLSLSGDHFFYGNPLASNGRNSRREWFGTACCPANIARLIASLGNYVYAQSSTGIWVNLFVGSNTSIDLAKGKVGLNMETNYPLDGKVKITVAVSKKIKYALHIRIPGYVNGIAAPGGLYSFLDKNQTPFVITVNGVAFNYTLDKGYAVIDREWKNTDVVEMNIPMEVKKIIARDELKQDNDRLALQRGPLVYCFEGADNNGKAWNMILPQNTVFIPENFKVKDEDIIALVSNLPVVNISADGIAVTTGMQQVKAIPYYTWCNRGSNPMQVWLPTKIKDVKINN